MPIYAFQCRACGHRFDRLQKMSDPDPTTCPACGAEAVARQVTAPSFRLSGSGWYETDFKSGGESRRNLSEKSEGAGTATTSATATGSTTPSDSGSKGSETKTAPASAPSSSSGTAGD